MVVAYLVLVVPKGVPMSELLSRLMNAALFVSMVSIGLIWVQGPEQPVSVTPASVVLSNEVAE